MPNHIFISHCTADDHFVKRLRVKLEDQGFTVWADSRNLRGGDILNPEIQAAIENASGFMAAISKNTFNSSWMLKETKAALEEQTRRGPDYRVVPLLLDGMGKSALDYIFPREPLAVHVKSDAGGLAEAMPGILAALGKVLPDDAAPHAEVPNKALYELVLLLTEPRMEEKDGVVRPTASARLIYKPASRDKREMVSKPFIFTSPMGPLESDELSWYLERYCIWPTGVFTTRAEKIEARLPQLGGDLFHETLANPEAAKPLAAWEHSGADAALCFTVQVDPELPDSRPKEERTIAREAASLLLGLPWELLHDGKDYLCQGARAARVRRNLPNRDSMKITAVEPPIRVLLVSPRPEDESAAYINHRASALPLAEALEEMGDLAELSILSPPTFPAMEEELLRASKAGKPYHVVHFDGHGVYDRQKGLGALCFEDPKDSAKLSKRRSDTIDADKLANVIREHYIPLVFLEACQSAKTLKDPVASVAAALIDRGVASAAAMSHSVLVGAASKFVKTFYSGLANGAGVGEAMLAGRRDLKSDPFRFKVFGAGDLNLQDWFVPILYQEGEDVQLFKKVPSRRIRAVDKEAKKKRLGELPAPPLHHFVGRSRELLTLERLLHIESYAVLCGQGGEGKTVLATELGRWLVLSKRFHRTAFVSLEKTQESRAVLDALGRQLLPKYSVAEYSGDILESAFLPVQRALEDFPTLIILDNMESILPPPGSGSSSIETDAWAGVYEPRIWEELSKLCRKLMDTGGTRLLFTSREPMPAPFDHRNRRVQISSLDTDDAIRLVRQAMTLEELDPRQWDKEGEEEARESLKDLVQAVHCHARSLVLLAPYIHTQGVEETGRTLNLLMEEMDKRFPDSRERPLFASVKLSLNRLSPDIRRRIRVLGVFHGGSHIGVLKAMLGLGDDEMPALIQELVGTGLAELMHYGHLKLNPALCPYLLRELDEETRAGIKEEWAGMMGELARLLSEQRSQDAKMAAVLIILELPNLLALLEFLHQKGDPEATVDFAISLEDLLKNLGHPRVLGRVSALREEEAKKIGEWNHTAFLAAKNRIERLLERNDLQGALEESQKLLDKSSNAGEGAYPEAEYDIAISQFLLGRTLNRGSEAQAAMGPIEEAGRRFKSLADEGNKSAARMASVAISEKGDCLIYLGRLDDATEAYKEGISRDENLGDVRGAAVGKGNLGTVRLYQKNYEEALQAYKEARETFESLGDPGSVAVTWHQTGMAYESMGRLEEAETAYRKSLAIEVEQKNLAGEASSLGQLGIFYQKMNRLEEAAILHRQALDIRFKSGDLAAEGRSRNNLASLLIQLKRFPEARQELQRALECKKVCGHDVEPWKTWDILCDLEKAEGNLQAAAEARRRAIEFFLAFRRDGGENHEGVGPICAHVLAAIKAQETEEMKKLLAQLADAPGTPPNRKPLISALQAILSGARDPALADDPGLYYTDAAEVRLMLERI